MIRSLSLRTRFAIASMRTSGVPPALAAVERLAVDRDRLAVLEPDFVLRADREPVAERDPELERDPVPERDPEPDRDPPAERVDADRELDREPDPDAEPERDELVFRLLDRAPELPLDAEDFDRVERDDDELEPLEPEAPRLGCGIDLSPWLGGVRRHPTVFFSLRATAPAAPPRAGQAC
jgi:hypothetical protein